jgi:type IV secretory pathway VirB4 component
MPVSMKKAIVVDEGWSLVEKNPRTGKPYFPLAVEYVPEIARTGRHYNCSFIICTQLIADFYGRGEQAGPGRGMVESCSTKIVLKQDPSASSILKEAFNLSESEERFITNANIGEGLLVTQEGHVPFYGLISDLERKLFTTRPNEVKF